jgi:hypothetical protein
MTEPQENLFGEKPKPKKASFYNRYDLLSMLIKTMRIGDEEQAIQVMWLMLCERIPQVVIAKKLVDFASEDAIEPESFNFAFNAYQYIKEVKQETNTLSRVVIHLCKAKKHYACPEEHRLEVRRIHIREATKKAYRIGKKPLEVPSWVWDVYTAKGKQLKKSGEQIDERFSGVLKGSALCCRALYLRDGNIDPKNSNMKNLTSKHLARCEKEKITVDEYLEKYNITASEFLQPANE